MRLRKYQEQAVASVRAKWAAGARSVCVVAPTGSGKTVIGTAATHGSRTLWVAHRRELVRQGAAELRRLHGKNEIGTVMFGEDPNPTARVQVASTATLLSRGADSLGKFDLVVLDECHHYEADTYRQIRELNREARFIGLTATPQRDDGRPLGDTFEELVVAAHYSELIRDGFIVAPTVIRPPVDLGSDKAADPVSAWRSFAGSGRTLAFYPRLAEAKASIRQWQMSGVRADHLDGETPRSLRDEAIEAFTAGRIDLLTNVFVLTEGVDIPAAEVVLSCRKFEFVGTMIQAFGRVMRKAPGKERAIVIDLCGSTIRHGLPHDDREYSLTSDRPIRKASKPGEGEREMPVFVSEIVDVPLEMVVPGNPNPMPAVPVQGAVIPKPLPVTLRGSKLRALRARHGAKAARLAEEYWRAQGEG